ncbi:fatty acid synthase alpha subunit Lsd1 [Marasmius tenuissimus]|uniref:Fatty acid synthase alpha subunit Lsd1 n=1 Tax=Marasmius tenuissimus TaxID=585030 RepID=A0ABR2ZIL6_9AGAR
MREYQPQRVFIMPERAVVLSFARDVNYKAKAVGLTSKLPPEHPLEHGTWVFHMECLARLEGGRQTVSYHPPPPDSTIFKPVSDAAKGNGPCTLCPNEVPSDIEEAKPPSFLKIGRKFVSVAELFNQLHAKGRLYCVARGKELVAVFGEFIIRTHFAMEGHCFWIPTTQYRDIIRLPTENRGSTSMAYRVPSHLAHGPNSTSLVSIQAAFVRPDWTLLFCDHNVQITFHIMRVRRTCTENDVLPGSELWPYLWSASHGPIPDIEPVAHESVLTKFRTTHKNSKRPIYSVIKSDSRYFNGLGAQEACDMLVRNLVHPLTPTSWICSNDRLWDRLKKAIIDHFDFTRRLIYESNNPPFPHVSSDAAFKMNTHAHTRYITTAVFCYRRASVLVDQRWLTAAHILNLFDREAVLGSKGKAARPLEPDVAVGSTPFPTVPVSMRYQHLHIPNYTFYCEDDEPQDEDEEVEEEDNLDKRRPRLYRVQPEQDIKDNFNSTTLGPYSFQAFISNSWSPQHLATSSLGITPGPRVTTRVGNASFKRPLLTRIMGWRGCRSIAKKPVRKQKEKTRKKTKPTRRKRTLEDIFKGLR